MGNTGLLTPEEMIELTGCKQKESQRKNLIDNRIPYLLRADGWPRTTWAAVNARLSGNEKTCTRPASINNHPEGFDLGALGK